MKRIVERVFHVVVKHAHRVGLLLLPELGGYGSLLVRNVESEVNRHHERSVPFTSPPHPTLTLHAAKIHEEGHLVSTIIEKERVEDGVPRGSAHNGVSRTHASTHAARLHVLGYDAAYRHADREAHPDRRVDHILCLTQQARRHVITRHRREIAATHALLQRLLVARNVLPPASHSPHLLPRLFAVILLVAPERCRVHQERRRRVLQTLAVQGGRAVASVAEKRE